MPSTEERPEAAPSLRYSELHRLGPREGWRPVVGILGLVVLVLLAQALLTIVVGGVLVATGVDSGDVTSRLDGDPVTPSYLALVNLGWAVAIPAVLLVTRVVHRLPAGWVGSVLRRFRWRWLMTCLGLSIVALAVTLAVSAVLPAQGDVAVDVSGPVNPWTDQMRDFLLVVLLLTPLQAAGEEYAFRGYLTQAFGGLAGRFGERAGLAVAVVVPALLFAIAHGIGQEPAIFFDRFAFGIVAGVLVVLTGGLEAGIAMHVLNNFLAFTQALLYSDMTSSLNPSGATWWSIPLTLTQSLTYLLLAWWTARKLGVQRRSIAGGGTILEPQRGHV
ncbi:MAG TPA: type II CAAX endopeptidase family protein [Nocardioides sp.]|nr:type II CAAX endopeptidase family protein [Nocardioides sp.]